MYPARALSQQKEEEQQQKRSACKFLKNVTYERKKKERVLCVLREKRVRDFFVFLRGKRLGKKQKEEKKSRLGREQKEEQKSSFLMSKKKQKNKKSKKKSEKRKERHKKNFFSKTQILFYFLHFLSLEKIHR